MSCGLTETALCHLDSDPHWAFRCPFWDIAVLWRGGKMLLGHLHLFFFEQVTCKVPGVELFRVPASWRVHWCVYMNQELRACLIHSSEFLDEESQAWGGEVVFLLSPTCCGAWLWQRLSSWESPPVCVCGNGFKWEERWRAQLDCSLFIPTKAKYMPRVTTLSLNKGLLYRGNRNYFCLFFVPLLF